MAEFIIPAVVRKAIEIGSNLIIQAVPHHVREHVDWIQQEMTYIQSFLEDADGKQGDKRVAAFLLDIRDLGLEVEDILDKYFPKIVSSKRKGFFGIFGSISTTHKFVAEIETIKRRVEDIKSRRLVYGIQEKNVTDEGEPCYSRRRSFPHYDEPNVVGFEEHINSLVGKLLDKNSRSSVISITGMAGLGKTTLAKKVYNSVLRSFECSAWICVSQQPNMDQLLRDIARQVGLGKEKRENDIEANLFAFLYYKRYVIVIDDIWETQPWDYLKIGIPNNFENGSKIILTSRHRDVGVHVGGRSSLHELQPLDLNNSRNLFFKIVGGPPHNPEEEASDPLEQLENIAEKILKRCSGVPLAIVLVAGLLRKKERETHAWKAVLENMGQEEDECLKIFALSYKDLPQKLKLCFLYFGLFPQDCEIMAFDLINLWEAEGFIQGSGVREVDDVGDDYLNHLIARNMIQVAQSSELDGRVKSVRIHDILHALCVEKAKESNLFHTCNEVGSANSALKVRRVSTYHNSLRDYTNFSRILKLPALLCFREEDWKELEKKHFKNVVGDLRYLCVLRLQCGRLECRGLKISLPSEIGNLGHLSYIRLIGASGCTIKLPSSVINIKSLLTLDFRRCGGKFTIPDFIWKMKHLKHIFLPLHYEIKSDLRGFLLDKVKFLHPVKASSLNLQTLYGLKLQRRPIKHRVPKFTSLRKLGVSFEGCDLSNIKVLLDAITASHKLDTLRLQSRLEVGELHSFNIQDLNLFRFENLSRLHLRGALPELQHHVSLFPPNLTKLTLKFTFLKENPMKTLKKLPKLKILKLDSNSYIGQKMVCSGRRGIDDNFPQLQVLEVFDLPFLVELILEKEVMPQLNKLRISNFRFEGVIKLPKRIRDISIINENSYLE
ncbi:unnamed protein product [Camellia sinensis]